MNFLAALCGHNCGESVRRIMSKLGTNSLWSSYSLKGKKGKLVFRDLPLCKIVIKACIRVHKKASEIEAEGHIAECLKHAPHRPGGLKFKVNHFLYQYLISE